jgi:hypothetical protein
VRRLAGHRTAKAATSSVGRPQHEAYLAAPRYSGLCGFSRFCR